MRTDESGTDGEEKRFDRACVLSVVPTPSQESWTFSFWNVVNLQRG